MYRIFSATALAAIVGLSTIAPAHAQTAAGAKDPIRIAVLNSLSGPYAQYGDQSVFAAQLVFDKVNAQGGINGRRIELIKEDDGCSPKQAVGGATKLVAEKNLIGILGLTCSGAAIAVRDSVAPSTPIPFISFSGGGWTSSSPDKGGLKPNFFFMSTSVHEQAGSIVNFVMNELKSERIAFIGQTDVYGKEGLQGVTDMLDQYGKKLVASETVEARATDLTPQILKLQEAKPDVVIAFVYEIPAQAFLRQADELNFRPNIVTSGSIVSPTMYASLPEKALAKYYGTSVLKDSFSSQGMTPLMDELRSKFPGSQFNWLALMDVAGVEILLEAVRRAGPDPTPQKVTAELDKLKDFRTSTMAYPVTFTHESHAAGLGMHFNRVEKGSEVSAMSGYWLGTVKAAKAVP